MDIFQLIELVGTDDGTHKTEEERDKANKALHDMMPSPKVVQPLRYLQSLDAADKFLRMMLPKWVRRSGDDIQNHGKYFCTIAPVENTNMSFVVANCPSEANCIVMAALGVLRDIGSKGQVVQ